MSAYLTHVLAREQEELPELVRQHSLEDLLYQWVKGSYPLQFAVFNHEGYLVALADAGELFEVSQLIDDYLTQLSSIHSNPERN